MRTTARVGPSSSSVSVDGTEIQSVLGFNMHPYGMQRQPFSLARMMVVWMATCPSH